MTQRFLITGAASGIGFAVAKRARLEGAEVAACDHDVELLASAWGQQEVLQIPMDVTSPESVATGISIAMKTWDAPPTAIVHSAGIYHVAPTLELLADDWNLVISTNLTGALLVSQAAARAMTAADSSGSIVLISSIAAYRGDRDEPAAHYAASKGGVVALCRQLAAEWGSRGIRVNAVAPGVIDTPMLRIGDDVARMQDYLQDRVPLGRLGTADEVAGVCCFLAGPLASYISGAVIAVDGGAGAV